MKKVLLPAVIFVAIAACNNAKTEQSATTQTTTNNTEIDSLKTTGNTQDTNTTAINPDPAHNANNSIDWAGTYTGTLPCADCPGIETTIELKDGNTYAVKEEYKEKKDGKFAATGKFSWDKNGTIITLDEQGDNRKYFVTENKIIQVGEDGKPVEGAMAKNYELKKK